MKTCRLIEVKVNNNSIKYGFEVEGTIINFFTNTSFNIDYFINGKPLELRSVPLGVLAIPFICNILPIIWLTNSILVIDELDENFYNSISEFKKGYIDMYPDAEFRGKITVNRLINNNPTSSGRSAAFFSGGLDAWCTFIRHISEDPDLILLWGADIPYTNEEGWNKLNGAVSKTAKQFDKNLITVRTSFRKVIDESALDKAFSFQLHDGWWHGVQHGIGIIGHSAPCDFLRGVNKQYIAASFSPQDDVTCASHPSIDNNVRFFNCQVYHDAFITRPAKTKIIVDYKKENNRPINMHVCWKTTDGENCCQCEKCYRTIFSILLEDDNPANYGFLKERLSYKRLTEEMTLHYDYNSLPYVKAFWKHLKEIEYERKKKLRHSENYKYIKWIEKFDFDHPEKSFQRKKYFFIQRIKRLISR